MSSAITLEHHQKEHGRISAMFEDVIESAVPPSMLGQLDLFSDEEEQFLIREVRRMLWEPKIPNAGQQERKWVKMLRAFSHDDSLVVNMKMAAGRYAEAIEQCLPATEYIRRNGKSISLPGCYYTRKRVTKHTDKDLWECCIELSRTAILDKDAKKKWLAEFILQGIPERLSNFKMECLYLLRGADGDVVRLVRLMNTLGETSVGHELAGADILPNEMWAGAEKYRQWCGSKGNFTWGCEGGAANKELQLLQLDVTEEAAYREVRLIQFIGWHELKSDRKIKEEQVIEPGKLFIRGIWFLGDCAVSPEGHFILPDDDGIFWYDQQGYVISQKGRELEYPFGVPKLQPPAPDGTGLKIEQIRFDTSDWDALAADIHRTNPIGGFFREVCRRFMDTLGGHEGLLAIGAMLGYASAPEIYRQRIMFPGLFISGQMGSGKSTMAGWLMTFFGFRFYPGGVSLIRSATAPGMMAQMENHSEIPMWFDEFRQQLVSEDKISILRDAYGRSLQSKITLDGKQRIFRTAPLISGESTTSDAATRSRFPHVMASEQKRIANHFDWFQTHNEFFFLFFRDLLVRRREFVEMVMKNIGIWMDHPDVQGIPSRERITHSVCYAAFVAASVIFESHSAQEVTEYRKFLAAHVAAASADVQTDVNINVFMDDFATAFARGEINPQCVRVERLQVNHPPGAPNQGYWDNWKIYIEPKQAIKELEESLRKAGHTVTLRYQDLRDQLSRLDAWIEPENSKNGLKRRFGPKGSQVSMRCWGFDLDKHSLGYCEVSDEELKEALKDGTKDQFWDGDPRKGPLYAIVEAVLRSEKE